jgi:alpha-tubulin suppressor-like RCC1 family protein
MISSGRDSGWASSHFYAAKNDNTLWCWGNNSSSGRPGTGDTRERHLPTQVTAISDVETIIGTGRDHACVQKTNGETWCWGEGSAGELGDGACSDSLTPV